jgi:hypothetical protein
LLLGTWFPLHELLTPSRRNVPILSQGWHSQETNRKIRRKKIGGTEASGLGSIRHVFLWRHLVSGQQFGSVASFLVSSNGLKKEDGLIR